MRKILAVLVALALVMPAALAVDAGFGFGINVQTEKFMPLIWMCDSRVVRDDPLEYGRISTAGQDLVERTQNYAFEGEQIAWTVLVMDKNGIEKIKDVFVSVGPVQGNGQFIEANCQLDGTQGGEIDSACNARIDEETVTWDPLVMAYYTCTLTVEPAGTEVQGNWTGMKGEYWVAANVVDLDDQTSTFAENEYWFFNPVVALTISGLPLNFGTVRPDTLAYSNTITVGNGAETGSGVMMDMFITGTDFYDPAHSGAKCPTSNVLSLSALNYYAVSGAYSTHQYNIVPPAKTDDAEGYVAIGYGDKFNNPTPFYNRAEVIAAQKVGPYYTANILAPGAEMSVTFRLDLPMPCNGDFTSGRIYFWGEAI